MEVILINCATVLSIFLSSCLAVLMLIGNGYLALRLLKINTDDTHISILSIIGFIFICIVLNLLHFLLPIDFYVSISFFFIGLTFSLLHKIKIYDDFLDYKKLFANMPLNIGIVLIAFVVLSRSLEIPSNPDSAGYHLASIGWINRFYLIPGLANLHFRFGFNNMGYFNYPALFNFFPFFSRGYIVASGSLIIMTVLFMLRAQTLNFTETSLKIKPITYALFLGILLNLKYIDSPTPDLVIFLLEIIIFLNLYSFFFAVESIENKKMEKLAVISLSLVLITFKLSALFYGLIAILFILLRKQGDNKTAFIKITLFVALIIVPHLIRGYWLSGYPLFPNPNLAYEAFEWLVPKNIAISESNWIYSWARAPGMNPSDVLNNWNWFFPWVLRIRVSDWMLIIVALTSSFANIIHYKSIKKYLSIAIIALMAQCIISIAMWFYLAPDFRFLGSIVWIYLSISIGLNMTYLEKLHRIKSFKPSFIRASKLLGFAIFTLIFAKSIDLRYIHFSGFQEIPIPAYTLKKSESGLSVSIPNDGSCWMISGACTPYFNQHLKLIKENKLESGFAVSK